MHPFVLNARFEARTLFQKLDPRFDPRVFFVGFPLDQKDKRVGVGPEDSPFFPKDFHVVLARATSLEKQDPESESQWMPDPEHGWTEAHERLHQSKVRGIRGRALSRATTEAATAAPGNAGFVSYCGWPTEHRGHETVLILQLQKDVYDSHYHLTKGAHRERRGAREHRIDRSLIDAVAFDFLAETTHVLGPENPNTGFRNVDDLDHLLLGAAKHLMYTPALAGGNDHGLHGLFDCCADLSTMRYEGKEGVGSIIVARRQHPQIQVDLALTRPVPLRSFGAVRKLLQMGAGHLSLLCDSYEVYGLGKVLPTYDLASEDIFTIQFTKQFVWDVLHAGNRLMHVRYGRPTSSVPGFSEEKFRADLPRVLRGIGHQALERLCGLARSAAGQKHGCMLVISSVAAAEAERLEGQCTRVEPFPLTDIVMPLVTAIDGSVLVDTEGKCHAIGVILDGMASPKCSPERGSRYNSAVRYVFGRKDTMAVVKSEDGMVSVFPDLRPQVRRSEILSKLAELRALASKPTLDVKDLYPLIDWLRQHEFYLTPSECSEANRLHEEARKKVPADTRYVIRERPLIPDSEMDESYFLPE